MRDDEPDALEHWRRLREQSEPKHQQTEARSALTDAQIAKQIRSEVEAALRRQPAFTKVQIGGLSKFVSDYVRKRLAEEIEKVREEISSLRSEVEQLRGEVADLRDDLTVTSALARGEIKTITQRGKLDAA